MTEPFLQAGERRQADDGDMLVLSPRPVATGARPSDAVNWIRRKNATWMDLEGGDLVFAAEFSLMFLSLSLITIAIGFAMSISMYVDREIWSWPPPLVMIIGNIFCTLPFGLGFHLATNKAIREGPPIRLHRQRREVAMPHWIGGRAYQYPLWNWSIFTVIYIFFMFMCLGWGVTWLETPYSRGSVIMRDFLSVAFWISMVTVVPYLLIGFYLQHQNKTRLTYIYHPWEEIVAFIQKQQFTAPTIMTEQVMLTFGVPDPDDPEKAKAAASISVGHETVGLAQWECIRAYMDDGPDACPDPRDYGTLAQYRESCRQARQQKSLPGWLWKKVGDWFFQRYLARIITERRVKKLIPKTLPEQLKDWSEPVPDSERAQPSDELIAINTRLNAAYRRGQSFGELGPVRQPA